jgi:peptidyl-prolyl cis-trans isomerase B (cyclophilin B)
VLSLIGPLRQIGRLRQIGPQPRRKPIQEDDQANSNGFFWALAAITAVGAAIITLAIRNNDEPPPTPSYVPAPAQTADEPPPTTSYVPAPAQTADEPPPTPSYTDPAPARTAIAARGGAGQLPTFVASADLGANCQYPTGSQKASRAVDAPKIGKVPTDPAIVSVSMSTDQGNIGLLLNNAEAPCTVNNFASLAQKGFFNDTNCHRLTTASSLSVLQCGDPTGTGGGGPGYAFANEYPTNQYPKGDPALQNPVLYPRGTLAMANAGPGTNGSQFFMVYKDSQLPPNYTVFGTIDATGLATLDKIAAAGVAGGAEDGQPYTVVTVNSILLD